MIPPLVSPSRRALLTGPLAIIASRRGRASSRQVPAPDPGRPGDFDFLSGAWTIAHRRRKVDGHWDEFDGDATCWSILGGTASIEELRIPARDFSGLGIRLLDAKTRRWNDYWVNGKERVLDGGPGLTGGFVNGVGTFTAEDTANGTTTIYRGIWDQITPTSHRWRQGASTDGGKTWDDSWFMTWRRVTTATG